MSQLPFTWLFVKRKLVLSLSPPDHWNGISVLPLPDGYDNVPKLWLAEAIPEPAAAKAAETPNAIIDCVRIANSPGRVPHASVRTPVRTPRRNPRHGP